MTTSTAHPHDSICLPRPGEDEPRIERYVIPTYSPDGTSRVGGTTVERCVECGNATYDGVLREEPKPDVAPDVFVGS
jgi:hypothetical protein